MTKEAKSLCLKSPKLSGIFGFSERCNPCQPFNLVILVNLVNLVNPYHFAMAADGLHLFMDAIRSKESKKAEKVN